MKYMIKLISAFALISGLFMFVAPAANADTPTPTINITVNAASEASLAVNTVTTLDTDTSGKVMMSPLQDNHLTAKERKARATHWLVRDAKKCPTVANQPTTQAGIKTIKITSFVKKGAALKRFKKAVPSAKTTKKFTDGRRKLSVRCFWVEEGGEFTDTGIDPNGKKRGMGNEVGGPGTLKGRPMLFDTAIMTVKSGNAVVKQEVPRRRGQNAPGTNVVGDGDCVNPKANVVDLPLGSFVYSKAWSTFRQRVQGTLNQQLRVAGKGRVEQGGCLVEFEYDFLTEGSLAFDQTLWAKTKVEAEGKAKTAATSTDISSNTDVTGSIKNKLELQLRVAFSEQCNGTPPSNPEPTYSCNTLSVDKGNGRSVTIGAFSTSQSGGATFKHAVINWGDGSSETFASPVGKSHSYGADGSYTVQATAVFDVNGQEKQVSSNGCQSAVTFNTPPPPPPVHQNPIAELAVGEHAVDLGGTMPVFGKVKGFDGATATLGSPKVTPSDLGGIYNWHVVSTEADGVTPCEAGYVCYQGYFRLEKPGTPGTEVHGTLVATAKDNMNGSFITEPLEFKAAYIAHPDTRSGK